MNIYNKNTYIIVNAYVKDEEIDLEIDIDDYKDLTETIAAKPLTDKMDEVLTAAVLENDGKYVTNRDKN